MIIKHFLRGMLVAVTVTVVSGCSFWNIDEEMEKIDEVSQVFSGHVSAKNIDQSPIIVVALRDQTGSQVAGFRIVSQSGQFSIVSTPQPLRLFAFVDLNRDLAFQENEPNGWANTGQSVDPAARPTVQLTIEIAATSDNTPSIPVDIINAPLLENMSDIVQIQIGVTTTLDDPLFALEQATVGLGQPFTFMADGAAGVFFMEDYDPDRIPVLFVHGILDTPLRFAPLIESLDHSKYQAWVFSYPSGWYLQRVANGMYQILSILRGKYQFEQLHIVAHSMGGLVSRGGMNICLQDNACGYVKSYTTISTPWNGVASAKSGVEWSPKVVPVWRDLSPGSDYLATLFDTPLPSTIPHSLIFGFKQDSIFGSQSSDGVVKLSSQLRMAAQQQASQIRGYDEDHTSILNNESVIDLVNEILDNNSRE